MNTGSPERFVRIDVAHARDRALVEKGGFDRSATPSQELSEPFCAERSLQRLTAEALPEVRRQFVFVREQPGAEAPDVAVRDVRAVV